MDEKEKLELKILALKEGTRDKIASLVTEYEDRIADLRVELTRISNEASVVMEELSAARQELRELRSNEEVYEGQSEPAEAP